MKNIMDGRNPAGNIALMPDDVISVPKGQMVYILGNVLHPINIVVGGDKSVTVLQAIAIASGLAKAAKSKETRILRLTPGSAKRTELVVNVQDMLRGKLDDVTLKPEDILFVPNSLAKEIASKTVESVTGLSTLIYRLP
jgi:polysaccharide export outer membrane protein